MTKPFSLLRDKMSANAKAESERLFQETWENMSILKTREQLARLKPRNPEAFEIKLDPDAFMWLHSLNDGQAEANRIQAM